MVFITFHHDTQTNSANLQILCIMCMLRHSTKFGIMIHGTSFQALNLCRDKPPYTARFTRNNHQQQLNHNKKNTHTATMYVVHGASSVVFFFYFWSLFVMHTLSALAKWKMQNTSNIIWNPVALEFHFERQEALLIKHFWHFDVGISHFQRLIRFEKSIMFGSKNLLTLQFWLKKEKKVDRRENKKSKHFQRFNDTKKNGFMTLEHLFLNTINSIVFGLSHIDVIPKICRKKFTFW